LYLYLISIYQKCWLALLLGFLSRQRFYAYHYLDTLILRWWLLRLRSIYALSYHIWNMLKVQLRFSLFVSLIWSCFEIWILNYPINREVKLNWIICLPRRVAIHSALWGIRFEFEFIFQHSDTALTCLPAIFQRKEKKKTRKNIYWFDTFEIIIYENILPIQSDHFFKVLLTLIIVLKSSGKKKTSMLWKMYFLTCDH